MATDLAGHLQKAMDTVGQPNTMTSEAFSNVKNRVVQDLRNTETEEALHGILFQLNNMIHSNTYIAKLRSFLPTPTINQSETNYVNTTRSNTPNTTKLL